MEVFLGVAALLLSLPGAILSALALYDCAKLRKRPRPRATSGATTIRGDGGVRVRYRVRS